MSQTKLSLAALALAGVLAGCGGSPETPRPASSGRVAPATEYVAPPEAEAVRLAGETLVISGRSAPGAQLRLATPQGQAQFTTADSKGRWTTTVPAGEAPRILGLSASKAGRQTQSQGYLLLAPAGQAALLRAGGGAVRLDPRPATGIGAFDFDLEGGAVVSGTAPPRAAVILRVDGRQAAEGRADARGRFSIALPTPIGPGRHNLQISGEGFSAQASVDARRAQPLTAGPFRGETTAAGVRADWQTPGGGMQSTLILG